MLDGKPYLVGFPYGAEGAAARRLGAVAGRGRADAAGPGRPSLAYGFSYDFLRYFVKQDPAWSYTAFDLSTFTAETQRAAGDAVADGSGSVGVPLARRQAPALPRLGGSGAVAAR